MMMMLLLVLLLLELAQLPKQLVSFRRLLPYLRVKRRKWETYLEMGIWLDESSRESRNRTISQEEEEEEMGYSTHAS
uniref:Secreted protein n=1 Tax=Physcomitrium patens TaxID=3218 RepID=A0A2K1JCY3_PHYPA|nr:hypothetical protein PHYPA_019646 [Physcomitrium patens]